jgi:hypothetical protein
MPIPAGIPETCNHSRIFINDGSGKIVNHFLYTHQGDLISLGVPDTLCADATCETVF